jgi:hypothetical protein
MLALELCRDGGSKSQELCCWYSFITPNPFIITNLEVRVSDIDGVLRGGSGKWLITIIIRETKGMKLSPTESM